MWKSSGPASRIVRESGGEPREVIDGRMWEQNLFGDALQPEEIIPLAREVLEKAIAFRDEQSSTRYNAVINKARAYLAREYQNSGVTLNDVSSHVCMSNSHFCTIFSQEMGVTFTEYLTNLRMSKAKELLRTTQMRSSDVAYAVGYNDPTISATCSKNTPASPRGTTARRRREHKRPAFRRGPFRTGERRLHESAWGRRSPFSGAPRGAQKIFMESMLDILARPCYTAFVESKLSIRKEVAA